MFNLLFLISFILIHSYVEESNQDSLFDRPRRIQMGIPNNQCDDANTMLENDWDGSPINYTCIKPEILPVQMNIESIEECENVPDNYFPRHFCMKDNIIYNHILPTHGDHRPLWPKFGEYQFVPVQRWSHNIEHGAIVMLYHPCADPNQVSILRELVVNCVRKHIISPYNLLSEDRPLALIGWGCRLTFNRVDNTTVISFIKKKALHGPEGHYPKEGQYDKLLLKLAQPPLGSDINDIHVCPNNGRK